MRILVTNDAGIASDGVPEVARPLVDLGDVTVVAPDAEYSGAGASLGAMHLIRPEVHDAHIDGVDRAWSVSGPPGLCVIYSRLGLFGDPFDLDIEQTVSNAVARAGAGVPVALMPEDFAIERTESEVRSSTVLMLDLSLSMPMRGNFLPAKKMAMALHSLMSSQFPRDFLGVVTFSEVAREIRPERLPEVSWDYVYGTNMQHGFALARAILARQSGNRQIIMVTDGEPTAHLTDDGRPLFAYPPTQETVDRTLREVRRCTRDNIRINVFMLDATPHLTRFIEQVTRLNGGRAFMTDNRELGDYVLVDFVEQRRTIRSRR